MTKLYMKSENEIDIEVTMSVFYLRILCNCMTWQKSFGMTKLYMKPENEIAIWVRMNVFYLCLRSEVEPALLLRTEGGVGSF